ncbi:hypothetical protein FOL47_008227 [Perkinsus chesapeaki]|uniref:Cyclic nucleotide-binding domain-containing protein n=1 Tax=Perkinsus chesapeaki TaxID=330153 RepID=A0A7J6LG09_PERCH|nr:hypothetical protein FOL47_008227 [Perkinsus chesapeaki]
MVIVADVSPRPQKKASFRRVQSLAVPSAGGVGSSPRKNRQIPGGSEQDIFGPSKIFAGNGLGGTVEMSPQDMLLEIQKMQIGLAKALAQDLAEHHRSIVEQVREIIAGLSPGEAKDVEVEVPACTEAEPAEDLPCPTVLDTRRIAPGRKRLHSRAKDAASSPGLQDLRDRAAEELPVLSRSMSPGKTEDENRRSSRGSLLDLPGSVSNTGEIKKRVRRSRSGVSQISNESSHKAFWSNDLTEDIAVVGEDSGKVDDNQKGVTVEPVKVVLHAETTDDSSPKGALNLLVASYNAAMTDRGSNFGTSQRSSSLQRKSRPSGERLSTKSLSKFAHQTKPGMASINGNLSDDRSSSARWVVYPDRKFRLFWDFIGLLFIAYQSFLGSFISPDSFIVGNPYCKVIRTGISLSEVPYLLTFDAEPKNLLLDVDRCVDIFFMTDLVLNFFTGFWSRGELNLEHRAIIANYTSTWFLIDLMASTPFSWLLAGHDAHSHMGASAIVGISRIMRLARLLRLVRLRPLLTKMEEHIESDVWLVAFTMFKMFLGLMCFSHWIACCWWAIGEAQIDSEDNWVRENSLDIEGALYDKYVRSLFYAVSVVSTMYGPVAAENNSERNFTMLLMLAAGVIFAVVVGSVTNLVVSFGEYKTEFRQRMKRAMKFMRANNVGPHLQLRVRRYIENLLDNQFESKAKAELMTMLSESLKNEMQLTLMGKLLRRYKFFTCIREELLARICMACSHVFCAPGDVMFYQGEPADGMYFVRKGKITLVAVVTSGVVKSTGDMTNRSTMDMSANDVTKRSPQSRKIRNESADEEEEVVSEEVRSLKADDYVCEEYLFIAGDYDATGLCGSFTELVKLKRDDLLERISNSPESVTLYMEAKAVYCITKNDMDSFIDLIADEVVSPFAIDELKTGDTLLMLAVRWGRDAAVDVMTEIESVAVNTISPVDQRTPLHVAIKDLKVDIVSYLLDGGANPLIMDESNLTAINYATSPFDVSGLKIMVESKSLRRRETAKLSGLMTTAIEGKKGRSRSLTGSVRSLDGLGGDNTTEKFTEVANAVLEIRNILAIALARFGEKYDEIYDDTSSDASSDSSGSLSALRASSGSSDVEKHFSRNASFGSLGVANGGKKSHFLQRSASMTPNEASGDAVSSMRSLLKNGVEATLVDEATSEPLLILAVKNGCSVGMASVLLEFSADPNVIGPEGDTSLMIAVAADDRDMIKCLVSNGAQLNVTDANGRTLMEMTEDAQTQALLKAMDLHSAAERNDIEACKMAIESGAELDLPHPKTGVTPLHTAVEKGHYELSKILLAGEEFRGA